MSSMKYATGSAAETFQMGFVDFKLGDFLLLGIHWAKLNQNLQWWSLGGPLFQIISDSSDLHPRWPQLLKIEISTNGQELLHF